MTAESVQQTAIGGIDKAAIQRRVLAVLFIAQIVGGVSVAIGLSVGALLAAEMAGVAVSGLAQSAAVVGSALTAIPATRISRRYGRRLSLGCTYLVAAAGAAIVVLAVTIGQVAILFAGLFLFGAGTAAGSQSRYAALDLAPPNRRGRHLSIVVWAITIGAMAGPNIAPIAGSLMGRFGIPTLAGPFAFSVGLFGLGAAILFLFLRPDPLQVAGLANATDSGDARPAIEGGMRAALATVMAAPAARLGIISMAVGHIVMVGVMSMTPVHISSAGHDSEHTLRIVGIVLSLHIAGMFALAPVTGWLSDRLGRRPVIICAAAVLLIACAVAGTAHPDSFQLSLGLTLLGFGWSGTMIAGSTLLAESVPAEVSTSAQGLSDVTMGTAGAVAGALSGFVLQATSYAVLAMLAAIATIPLVVLAWRPGKLN